MLFQQPSKLHLSTVLAQGAVVSQDEVSVGTVEHGELAQRVGHGLVDSRYLTKSTMQSKDAELRF